MGERQSLIRDPYTDADSGEVRLTLNYLGMTVAVPRGGQLQDG